MPTPEPAARLRSWRLGSAAGLRRALPSDLKPALRRAADMVDVVPVTRFRRTNGYAGPIPVRRLRARIGVAQVAPFVVHGQWIAGALDDAAMAAGVDLREAGSVLDFGCGCGRVLVPLLSARERPGLVGTDVDAEAIAWLRRACDGRAEFHVNAFTPPLPLESGRFDVLFSVSIMTHLDEPSQDLWLNEVHRVLAPGGLALITVHGEYPYDQTRNGHSAALTTDLLERLRLRGALHEEGFVFEPYELHRGSIEQFPGISGTYGLTFQHPARVARRWGERFEVLDHRVNAIDWWQDLVVLRKRSGAR